MARQHVTDYKTAWEELSLYIMNIKCGNIKPPKLDESSSFEGGVEYATEEILQRMERLEKKYK